MHKRHSPFRKKCVKSVSKMLLIAIALLAGSDLQGETPSSSYVLPTYPPMANRSRVQGSFLVHVEVEGGRVRHVEIVSHKLTMPGGREIKPPSAMTESIVAALSQWRFDRGEQQQRMEFTLTVLFRLTNRVRDAESQVHTFTVEEKGGKPTSIIIEADKLGADIETRDEH